MSWRKCWLALCLLVASSNAVALAGDAGGENSGHRLHVVLAEGQGASSLTVIEDGEHERKIAGSRRIDGPSHLVLMVDLEASTPKERFRALPPLADFLRRRIGRGDRVTVTAWTGRGRDVDLLCSVAGPAGAARLDASLDTLARHKSAAHEAARQRGETARQRLEQAHRALARAIELTAGTGLPTRVLYLGAAGSLATGPGQRSLRSIVEPESETSDSVGSVHYLVSLPRPGPLRSLARHASDLLVARAAEAQAAVYPLRAGRPALGQDAWLAGETGGRGLDIRHLASELAAFEAELDRTWELVLERPAADSRFHRLEVQGDIGGQGARWPRGFYAAGSAETLDLRARAAAVLGAVSAPTPGLAGRLGPLRRDGDALVTDLRLHVAPAETDREKPESLRLHVAVSMPDGRLLQQNRRFDGGSGEIHLPLRFGHGAHRLGLAARLEPGGEISTFSWPLARSGDESGGEASGGEASGGEASGGEASGGEASGGDSSGGR